MLDRAHESAMLRWSVVRNESLKYTALENGITVSNFAISKSLSRDRLITWPKSSELS